MKIQLKRSVILDGSSAKKPLAEQMDYGELAVNYNEADPTLFLKVTGDSGTDTVIKLAGSGYLVDTDLDGYATEQWVEQRVAGFATEQWVEAQGYVTIDQLPDEIDLTGYATEYWVEQKGYLTDALSDGKVYGRKDGTWSELDFTVDPAVETSPTPPTDGIQNGQMWWDSEAGYLYIYYVDDNSGQWVPATPSVNPGEVPQNTSDLVNDSGFITIDQVPPGTDLTGYATEAWVGEMFKAAQERIAALENKIAEIEGAD